MKSQFVENLCNWELSWIVSVRTSSKPKQNSRCSRLPSGIHLDRLEPTCRQEAVARFRGEKNPEPVGWVTSAAVFYSLGHQIVGNDLQQLSPLITVSITLLHHRFTANSNLRDGMSLQALHPSFRDIWVSAASTVPSRITINSLAAAPWRKSTSPSASAQGDPLRNRTVPPSSTKSAAETNSTVTLILIQHHPTLKCSHQARFAAKGPSHELRQTNRGECSPWPYLHKIFDHQVDGSFVTRTLLNTQLLLQNWLKTGCEVSGTRKNFKKTFIFNWMLKGQTKKPQQRGDFKRHPPLFLPYAAVSSCLDPSTSTHFPKGGAISRHPQIENHETACINYRSATCKLTPQFWIWQFDTHQAVCQAEFLGPGSGSLLRSSKNGALAPNSAIIRQISLRCKIYGPGHFRDAVQRIDLWDSWDRTIPQEQTWLIHLAVTTEEHAFAKRRPHSMLSLLGGHGI